MVTIGILNAGTSPEIQMMYDKYEIEKVPTFIFFKNGQIVDRIDSRDPQEVFDAIQKHGQEKLMNKYDQILSTYLWK